MSEFTDLTHQSATARIRLTPWDERSLRIRTAEIIEASGSDSDLPGLWNLIDDWIKQHGVEYSFGRISADAMLAKQSFQRQGYRFVETSLLMSRLRTDEWPRTPASLSLQLSPVCDQDMEELRTIAINDFHHGRFLEDPSISPVQARARTGSWLADLCARGNLHAVQMHKKNIGFVAHTIGDDGCADLILYGVSSNFPMLALPLWVSALKSLNEAGATRYRAMISAANVHVVNLYLKLGFSVTSVHYGFSKWHTQ